MRASCRIDSRPRSNASATAARLSATYPPKYAGSSELIGDQEAALHEGVHVVLAERGKDLQLHVGEGTDGQRDLLGRQPLDEPVIFQATHAVIDAPRLQHVERLPDVLGRTLLAGVRHARQAQQAGLREDPGELGGRVADLGRVEADRRQMVGERAGLLQRLQRLFLAAVAQEAQDQARRDAEPCPAFVEGAADPRAAGLEGDAAPGMGLRVEEDLGVAHALAGRLRQIGQREVVEVPLGEEHGAVGVVDVEERLQVFEDIGPTEGVHVGVGQRHAVAAGQLEGELRLERALNVHVQLRLGKAPYEGVRLRVSHGPAMVAHADRRRGPGAKRNRSLRLACTVSGVNLRIRDRRRWRAS